MLSSNVAWSQNNTKLRSVSCLSYLRLWNSTTSCILPPSTGFCAIYLHHLTVLENWRWCSMHSCSAISCTAAEDTVSYLLLTRTQYGLPSYTFQWNSLDPNSTMLCTCIIWTISSIALTTEELTFKAYLSSACRRPLRRTCACTPVMDIQLNTTRTAAWCAILLSSSWQFYPNWLQSYLHPFSNMA